METALGLNINIITLHVAVSDLQVNCIQTVRRWHGPGRGGGGGTPLYDLNGDVRPDRVWFSGCFVLNGVSISSLSVLNRISLHDLMAKTRN